MTGRPFPLPDAIVHSHTAWQQLLQATRAGGIATVALGVALLWHAGLRPVTTNESNGWHIASGHVSDINAETRQVSYTYTASGASYGGYDFLNTDRSVSLPEVGQGIDVFFSIDNASHSRLTKATPQGLAVAGATAAFLICIGLRTSFAEPLDEPLA